MPSNICLNNFHLADEREMFINNFYVLAVGTTARSVIQAEDADTNTDTSTEGMYFINKKKNELLANFITNLVCALYVLD